MAEVTRVFEEKWKDTAAQAKDLSSLPLYTPLDELEVRAPARSEGPCRTIAELNSTSLFLVAA